MDYNPQTDTLTIQLTGEMPTLPAANLTLVIRGDGRLLELRIAHPGPWLADVLQLGIPISSAATTIWYDANESSMIRAFGYNPTEHTLDVVFRHKGFYRYHDVPPHIVAELSTAPSKGQYLRRMIINRFPTERSR